jgi:hypothetical protein
VARVAVIGRASWILWFVSGRRVTPTGWSLRTLQNLSSDVAVRRSCKLRCLELLSAWRDAEASSTNNARSSGTTLAFRLNLERVPLTATKNVVLWCMSLTALIPAVLRLMAYDAPSVLVCGSKHWRRWYAYPKKVQQDSPTLLRYLWLARWD